MEKKRNFYEALGFVEALIAIMVVGISSVVLMQIAVNTMHNTIQNEIIDIMTQYAVEGGEWAQDIANRETVSGEDYFPEIIVGDLTKCFAFAQDEDGVIGFAKESQSIYRTFEEGVDRPTYKDEAILNEDDEFFRVACFDGRKSPESSFVVGKIIVGQRSSDGTITKGNSVKDYTYLSIVKL
jgi:hypothetical protein